VLDTVKKRAEKEKLFNPAPARPVEPKPANLLFETKKTFSLVGAKR